MLTGEGGRVGALVSILVRKKVITGPINEELQRLDVAAPSSKWFRTRGIRFSKRCWRTVSVAAEKPAQAVERRRSLTAERPGSSCTVAGRWPPLASRRIVQPPETPA